MESIALKTPGQPHFEPYRDISTSRSVCGADKGLVDSRSSETNSTSRVWFCGANHTCWRYEQEVWQPTCHLVPSKASQDLYVLRGVSDIGEHQLATGLEDPMDFSNGFFSADRIVYVVDCKAGQNHVK